jgi:hypothetical protein
MLKGNGYSVGPGYEVQGSMVFDLSDKDDHFLLLVREDKPFDPGDKTRRRENAVYVSTHDLRNLLAAEWLRNRLGLS